MALSANTVLEVRLTGDDTNGGGFVTGQPGTDWSQQDSPQYSVTDGVATGNNVITSASASFGADVVGNIVCMSGGTGSLVRGWYQITSRTSTTITLDRVVAAGTGITIKIGGALASPGQAAAIATVQHMRVFIKYNASPYVITTASTNVSGGCLSITNNTHWAGYDTNRSFWVWPVQNRPTLQLGSGVTSATIFGNLNSGGLHQHLILDGNSQTGSSCYWSSGELYYIKAMNGVTRGMQQNVTARAILCEATNCLATPINFTTLIWCVSHDNPFVTSLNNGAMMCEIAYGCLSYGNNGEGIVASRNAVNCVAYDNARCGFNAINNGPVSIINCISEDNGSYGYGANTGNFSLINCAAYNNVSGRSGLTSGGSFIMVDVGGFNLTSTAFTNAAALDFSLDNTPGGGADLRGVGFPTSFPV